MISGFMDCMIHSFAFLAFGKSDRAKVWSLHSLAEIATPEFNQHGSITITLYIKIYQFAPYLHDICSWNTSTWKAMANLFYIVNIMATDGLATQEAEGISNHAIDHLCRINSASHVKG